MDVMTCIVTSLNPNSKAVLEFDRVINRNLFQNGAIGRQEVLDGAYNVEQRVVISNSPNPDHNGISVAARVRNLTISLMGNRL